MQQGHAFRDTVLSEILPLRVVTKVSCAYAIPPTWLFTPRTAQLLTRDRTLRAGGADAMASVLSPLQHVLVLPVLDCGAPAALSGSGRRAAF